jgi:xylulokinase
VELREGITEPEPERSKSYEDYYDVYRSLYPATRSAMSRLADLAADSIDQ